MTQENKNVIKRTALWRLMIQKRNFFVKPNFQKHFIIYVMSMTLISLALFYISQQVFFHQFFQSGEQLGLPAGHPYYQLLKDQQAGLTKIFFITAVLIAFFILFSALFFSHRIAGPLYRLEIFFREAHKNPELMKHPLSFRKNDFFQELPKSINEFIQSREHSTGKSESSNQNGVRTHRVTAEDV